MRCPRCNSHVMPGLPECINCGCSLTAPAPAARTCPDLGADAKVDLFGQRRRLKRSRRRISQTWQGVNAQISLSQAFRTAAEKFPPVWVAFSGMLFGLWFFRNGQKKAGSIVAGLEAVLVLAIAFFSVHDQSVSGLSSLAQIVALSAGIEAVRRHLVLKGYKSISAVLMSILTIVAVVVLLYLLQATVRLFIPGSQLVRINNAIALEGDMVSSGSHGILAPRWRRADGIRRGDIVVQDGGMFRVIALPYDVVDVRDCEIYVNDDRVQASHWPIIPRWESSRCEVLIYSHLVPSGHYLSFMQYYNNGKLQWRIHQYPSSSVSGRLMLIYWPPGDWRMFP